jgi:hypothetical protein
MNAGMVRAEKADGLAQVLAVLGDHCRLEAAPRTKMRHQAHPLFTPHLSPAQMLKQRLAMQQSQRGLLELLDLQARIAARDPAHQIRMRTLPLGPARRAFHDAAGEELLADFAVFERCFDAVGR